jgi:hypothetical protein
MSQASRVCRLFESQQSLVNEALAKADTVWAIDSQNLDCHTSDGRLADKDGPSATEVIIPGVCPRIKQRCDLLSLLIESGDIWALLLIARVAGKGQVVQIVGTAVLLCNDMINLGRTRVKLHQNTTIFAAVGSTQPNRLPNGPFHDYELSPAFFNDWRAFEWSSPRKLPTRS